MAEQQVEQEPDVAQAGGEDNEEEEETPGYKPPAPKSVNEIAQMDQEDESLTKYKKALLGSGGGDIIPYPDDPRTVIMKKLSLVVEDREPIEMDLTQSAIDMKNTKLSVKEGIKYRLKMDFFVQREIVSGLRYRHTVHRKGIRVDSVSCMVGSYGPKLEVQSYRTPEEDAPSGMLARGDYRIKSKFTDDDKNTYLEWEWTLCIKKDWD